MKARGKEASLPPPCLPCCYAYSPTPLGGLIHLSWGPSLHPSLVQPWGGGALQARQV